MNTTNDTGTLVAVYITYLVRKPTQPTTGFGILYEERRGGTDASRESTRAMTSRRAPVRQQLKQGITDRILSNGYSQYVKLGRSVDPSVV